MTAVWVFDVDGCLIDSLTGSSLRPGAQDLLERLRAHGCTVLVWSAGGAEYAHRRAEERAIAHLVDGFHEKERRDSTGRYVTDAFLDGLDGVVFVDDRPEDMPVGADVIAVRPYIADNAHDTGLAPAAARAGLIGG